MWNNNAIMTNNDWGRFYLSPPSDFLADHLVVLLSEIVDVIVFRIDVYRSERRYIDLAGRIGYVVDPHGGFPAVEIAAIPHPQVPCHCQMDSPFTFSFSSILLFIVLCRHVRSIASR